MPIGQKMWTETEKAVLAAEYPLGGGLAVQAVLPHRKITEIRAKAARMKIKHETATAYLANHEAAWPMPTMDLLESLDCVRLRKWGRPGIARAGGREDCRLNALDGWDDGWEGFDEDSEDNESDDAPIPYKLTEAGRAMLDGAK